MKIQRYGHSQKIGSDTIRPIFPHESNRLGLTCHNLPYLKHIDCSWPQSSPFPIVPSTLRLGICSLVMLAMLIFL